MLIPPRWRDLFLGLISDAVHGIARSLCDLDEVIQVDTSKMSSRSHAPAILTTHGLYVPLSTWALRVESARVGEHPDMVDAWRLVAIHDRMCELVLGYCADEANARWLLREIVKRAHDPSRCPAGYVEVADELGLMTLERASAFLCERAA